MQNICNLSHQATRFFLVAMLSSLLALSLGCEGEKTERSSQLPCGKDENQMTQKRDSNNKCVSSKESLAKTKEKAEAEEAERKAEAERLAKLESQNADATGKNKKLQCSSPEVKFGTSTSASCKDKDKAEAECHASFEELKKDSDQLYSCAPASKATCKLIEGADWQNEACVAKVSSASSPSSTGSKPAANRTGTNTTGAQAKNDPAEESELKLNLALNYGSQNEQGFAIILSGQDVDKITDVLIEVEAGQTVTDEETNKHRMGVNAKITFKDVKGNSCSNGSETFYSVNKYWGQGQEISTVCKK